MSRKWIIYAYRSTVTRRWNYCVKRQGDWYGSYVGSWKNCIAAVWRWSKQDAS